MPTDNVINRSAYFTVKIARNMQNKSPKEREQLMNQLPERERQRVVLALKNLDK